MTAGLSALPGCLRLWPGVIPRASQTLPQHTFTCLVTSCAVAKPFPITQAHALLYPACQLNPSPFVSACFLLFWHSTIWHITPTFRFPFLSSLHCMRACTLKRYALVRAACMFPFFSQPDGLVFSSVSTNSSSPDTSVSVSSVEAWGNEALRIYWSPYTPLCIRETLFSASNRNTAPSILYTAPRRQLLFSRCRRPRRPMIDSTNCTQQYRGRRQYVCVCCDVFVKAQGGPCDGNSNLGSIKRHIGNNALWMMYYVIWHRSIARYRLHLPLFSSLPAFLPVFFRPALSLPLSVAGLLRPASTCIKISASKQITTLNGIKVTSISKQQCWLFTGDDNLCSNPPPPRIKDPCQH